MKLQRESNIRVQLLNKHNCTTVNVAYVNADDFIGLSWGECQDMNSCQKKTQIRYYIFNYKSEKMCN